MAKKGVGKVDPNVVYRVLEEQEKYIRNLYREKLRKNVKTSASQEMRYLLDLGIQMHREGRREKFEMSNYFRAELRTFTENFFKENDGNYISRLVEINSFIRFIALMQIEILKLLSTIFWMIRDQSPFSEADSNDFKMNYFEKMDEMGKNASDKTIKEVNSKVNRNFNSTGAIN